VVLLPQGAVHCLGGRGSPQHDIGAPIFQQRVLLGEAEMLLALFLLERAWPLELDRRGMFGRVWVKIVNAAVIAQGLLCSKCH
jgi:hypothetical protein